MVKDPVIKIDNEKYPDFIFFFTKEDNKRIAEYDSKGGYLFFNYCNIWSIFEKEYNMKYGEIKAFLKNMAEEHFKLKEVIPISGAGWRY